MAISPIEEIVDITGAALNKQIQKQKWYQEHANTFTSLIGLLVTIAAWGVTTPFGADPIVQIAVLIIGFAATVFGVSKTPNGVSKSQQAKIDAERAKLIGETPLIVEADQKE